jgi:hypothetical protein
MITLASAQAKPFEPQAFITEFAVAALHDAIPPRIVWFDDAVSMPWATTRDKSASDTNRPVVARDNT